MAAVVIGRNEGAGLERSLKSVAASGLKGLYVDSGSSDDSVNLSRNLTGAILELDPARAFSAARARNEGLAEVVKRWPETQYVMFLDGDCELRPNFPTDALQIFEAHPECAIVTGHLSERSPEQSIFNRLCAIEWRSPAGPIQNFASLGGIMAARISAFREVGGFNDQVIAGEDSELGVRLFLANHSIIKIDQQMAIHDARMVNFMQWWTRAIRAGHALAQRYSLNGRSRLQDCRRELRSTLFWGLFLPCAALLLVLPTRGASLILLAGYLALACKIYLHYRKAGLPRSDAWLVSRFTVYAKFANLIGAFRFWMRSFRGRFNIIEYK